MHIAKNALDMVCKPCYYMYIKLITGRALSVGGDDIRPSRDVQSLLIPESPGFSHGEYVKKYILENNGGI